MIENQRWIARCFLVAPFLVGVVAFGQTQKPAVRQTPVRTAARDMKAEGAAFNAELKQLCAQLKKDLPKIKALQKQAVKPMEATDESR